MKGIEISRKAEERINMTLVSSANTVPQELRDRATTLARQFDRRSQRFLKWTFATSCVCAVVFALILVAARANAQLAQFLMHAVSGISRDAPGKVSPNLDELMQELKAKDSSFVNYTYEGETTLSTLDPAIPLEALPGLPPEDREKFSKPHWNTQTTHVRTWTVRDTWRYEATGDMSLSYANDPREPMTDNDRVTFSTFGRGGRAESNMQVIAQWHPVLGLGLGKLRDPKLTLALNTWQLSGKDAAGAVVTATFADIRTLQLSRLERKAGGMLQVYDYGDYAPRGGPKVPTHISCEFSLSGEVQARATYDVQKVDTRLIAMPAPSPWFNPGRDIIDERVTPHVQFSFGELLKLNGGRTTLDQAKLMEFSRAKAKEALARKENTSAQNPSH